MHETPYPDLLMLHHQYFSSLQFLLNHIQLSLKYFIFYHISISCLWFDHTQFVIIWGMHFTYLAFTSYFWLDFNQFVIIQVVANAFSQFLESAAAFLRFPPKAFRDLCCTVLLFLTSNEKKQSFLEKSLNICAKLKESMMTRS